jgi:hypothetical protein
MKITNWRTRIEDKLAWKKIVEQAVPIIRWNRFTWWWGQR